MARNSQPAWRDIGFQKRANFLLKVAQELGNDKTQQEMAHTLTKETGKPIRYAIQEIKLAKRHIETFIDLFFEACRSETIQNKDTKVRIDWCPLGIAVVISPWNYPISTKNISACRN